MKKVINWGKKSKTLSEVKLIENISKNLQSFLEISLVQKEVFLSHKLQAVNNLELYDSIQKNIKRALGTVKGHFTW